jgi:hypothetical protein
VLHSFTGSSDGLNPYAGLIVDKQGAVYGATFGGGGIAGYPGTGTVFRLTLCPELRWRDGRENDADHDHDGCPMTVSIVACERRDLIGVNVQSPEQKHLGGTRFS